MKSLIIFLIFINVLGCQKKENSNIKVNIDPNFDESICPLKIQFGKIYGNHGKQSEANLVFAEMNLLLNDICMGNLGHLPALIHSELGLFVDAKAHWTKEEVVQDLKQPNGYFETYFFNQKLLDEKKGSPGNLTILMALKSAQVIYVDFHFDSSLETEIQFRFLENPKNVRYLINPIFGKLDGRWMLLRMF